MANAAQVKKIKILQRDAAVRECGSPASARSAGCCAYHDQLRSLGVTSSRELNNAGVDRLISWLVGQGATDTTQRVAEPWRLEIVRRYDELHELSALLGDVTGFSTAVQRSGFNRRQCGVAWPQTWTHGCRIIEGQKQLRARFVAAIETIALIALLALRAGRRADTFVLLPEDVQLAAADVH